MIWAPTMQPEPERLIESATASRFAVTRSWINRVATWFNRATFRIKRGTPAETLEEVGRRWRLEPKPKQVLLQLGASKPGAAFIDEKVQAINRAAFHRSAFALNAATHLVFVDLAAQLTMSWPALKAAAVAANLVLALVAHFEMRKNFRALLAGPNALPKKRRFWGLMANPKYNRAVKKSSKPHAKAAWKEKSLYRLGYFVNAGAIFLGSQFIIPPERLVFPFGFIIGKITGLMSTLVIVFDIWRGVRAGEDSRLAREREIAVYRHLDI
ncbi:conserved hypothetical protein [Rhodopseudomonas palustris BisB18]|uniref:Uncharacterized protein n=2 Tax=Rhodopseudomonas palustris TaxID=1076 RepID=Q21B83_RHOPB